jgi:hypothetical protein
VPISGDYEAQTWPNSTSPSLSRGLFPGSLSLSGAWDTIFFNGNFEDSLCGASASVLGLYPAATLNDFGDGRVLSGDENILAIDNHSIPGFSSDRFVSVQRPVDLNDTCLRNPVEVCLHGDGVGIVSNEPLPHEVPSFDDVYNWEQGTSGHYLAPYDLSEDLGFEIHRSKLEVSAPSFEINALNFDVRTSFEPSLPNSDYSSTDLVTDATELEMAHHKQGTYGLVAQTTPYQRTGMTILEDVPFIHGASQAMEPESVSKLANVASNPKKPSLNRYVCC